MLYTLIIHMDTSYVYSNGLRNLYYYSTGGFLVLLMLWATLPLALVPQHCWGIYIIGSLNHYLLHQQCIAVHNIIYNVIATDCLKCSLECVLLKKLTLNRIFCRFVTVILPVVVTGFFVIFFRFL